MRQSWLTTTEFARLNHACLPVAEAFDGHLYLVGSSGDGPDFRDVDVRAILADEDFDALFEGKLFLWSLLCYAVSEMLTKITGLKVDFQVQRRTEATEKYGEKRRNPIGIRARAFAGGGDATNLLFKHDFAQTMEGE